MSRIVLFALGSRGDVQPHLALAAALAQRHQRVAIMTSAEFADDVQRLGVEFLPGGGSLHEGQFITSTLGARLMQAGTASATVVLSQFLKSIAPLAADACQQHIMEDDIIVTGILGFGLANAVRAIHGNRIAYVTFAATLPTAYGQCHVLPLQPGKTSVANARHSHLGNAISLGMGAPLGNELRRRHRLPPVNGQQLARESLTTPTVVAASPLLAPPAPDWPVHTHHTGAWVPQPDSNFNPPQELTAFLAAGPPPLYVGFGSALTADSTKDIATIAAAAQQLNQRVIIRPNEYQKHHQLNLPTNVHLLGTTPHEWLFARTAAIVHHGGAGTTTAALRSAKPSSVIWHNFDQKFHARRCVQLGVGPRAFSKPKLNTKRLTELLWSLTMGPDAKNYSNAAQQVANQIQREQGAQEAAEWLIGAVVALKEGQKRVRQLA